MDSSQLWASGKQSNTFRTLCQICHRILDDDRAKSFFGQYGSICQKWPNKRVWKIRCFFRSEMMMIQCNSSMGWHRAIVNVIDLHLLISTQLKETNQKIFLDSSRLTNLDPFSILQAIQTTSFMRFCFKPGVPTSFGHLEKLSKQGKEVLMSNEQRK